MSLWDYSLIKTFHFTPYMKERVYRTSSKIIENILEGILREKNKNRYENKGIKKTHLIKYCRLKSELADNYFTSLENANYIETYEEDWGQRKITYIDITELGKSRYEWFVKINTELKLKTKKGKL